jgi:hypothetical protein
MEIMDGSFERALISRLRTELDALNVAVPAVMPGYSPRRSVRYVWTVGRPLALALAVALLLGSVAAFASGSPNPGTWVKEAEKSLGIPPADETPPIGSEASPSPESSESPKAEDGGQPTGAEREPAETRTVEPVERQSPEPASPNDGRSPEPAEHGPTPSAGDG